MSQTPPPNTLPEQPSFRQASKYQRSRHIVSWWGLLIGFLLGGIGGLYLAWVQFPVIETDTRPDQLQTDDKAHYVVAIALAFTHDSDLGLAIDPSGNVGVGKRPLARSR